jgi:threonine dehydratase
LLDQAVGARVWLKAETFQRSGSFKARGAFNAALVGLEGGDLRGLAAFSSGNHGQAVALAASELGLAATVVMPATSSLVKIAAVRGYGATVVTEGVTLLNRELVAAREAAEGDLILIHPHDDPQVIAGQATAGVELAQQSLDRGVEAPVVLVPVGGGGLISGVAAALSRWLPQARIVGVEPATGNDAQQSLRAGRLIELNAPPLTSADGAATLRLGQLPWQIIQDQIGEIVTVSERQIAEACWWLWSRCKLVVEPTGAMTVAAALAGVGSLSRDGGTKPSEIICFLSGGNCLPAQIASLVGDPTSPVLRGEGREPG